MLIFCLHFCNQYFISVLAGAFTPYHMFGFLLECLADLNENLKALGSKLHVFIGDPVDVFRKLHSQCSISKLCFQQDPEPIYHARDGAVKCRFLKGFLKKICFHLKLINYLF